MATDRILYTYPEACEAAHLGLTTMKDLVARGEIEAISIGRARRIPVAALLAWVDRQRESQAV